MHGRVILVRCKVVPEIPDQFPVIDEQLDAITFLQYPCNILVPVVRVNEETLLTGLDRFTLYSQYQGKACDVTWPASMIDGFTIVVSRIVSRSPEPCW